MAGQMVNDETADAANPNATHSGSMRSVDLLHEPPAELLKEQGGHSDRGGEIDE